MNTSNEEILKLYNDIVENKNNNEVVNQLLTKFLPFILENSNTELTFTKELWSNPRENPSNFVNDYNTVNFGVLCLRNLLVNYKLDIIKSNMYFERFCKYYANVVYPYVKEFY